MFDELMANRTCLPELFTTSPRPVDKSPRRIASKLAGCRLRLDLVGTEAAAPQARQVEGLAAQAHIAPAM
jgi:hypothetical protein